MGNYHAFFRLFLDAPNMGGYIIDHFSDRERIKALMVMSKAYVVFYLSRCAFANNPVRPATKRYRCLSSTRNLYLTTSCKLVTSSWTTSAPSSQIPTAPMSRKRLIVNLLCRCLRRCLKRNTARSVSRVLYSQPPHNRTVTPCSFHSMSSFRLPISRLDIPSFRLVFIMFRQHIDLHCKHRIP
jgi:hypothetical protein